MKGIYKINLGADGIESFWKFNKWSNKALQALSYFIVISYCTSFIGRYKNSIFSIVKYVLLLFKVTVKILNFTVNINQPEKHFPSRVKMNCASASNVRASSLMWKKSTFLIRQMRYLVIPWSLGLHQGFLSRWT